MYLQTFRTGNSLNWLARIMHRLLSRSDENDDLVVIDRDNMTMPEADISEIQALVTMIGGKFMFLHSDFANEYNLRPAGTLISTWENLRSRRPEKSFIGIRTRDRNGFSDRSHTRQFTSLTSPICSCSLRNN